MSLDGLSPCRQEVKALHEETEAIYKENQSLNRQQIALNEEVCRLARNHAFAVPRLALVQSFSAMSLSV